MTENGTHRCWDHEDCPHRWCDGELQQQDRFNVMCLECELVWTHVRYPPTHTEPPKDQLTDADGEVWAEKRAVATDGGQDARVGSGIIRCDGGEDPDRYNSGTERSPLPDTGVAATGYVCQNFPAHPGEEPEMVSAGPGEGGRICPVCGRMAGGPDDEIPYADPPYDEPGLSTTETDQEVRHD